ncbi:uncharacterized protein LOC134256871 [Saccostrea cucullata]|uniref:uncharacterized protein LOC134256871 n=1 Tax=Saccostrea cuccullata TaxID=36930 RepID=UPI002ED623BB
MSLTSDFTSSVISKTETEPTEVNSNVWENIQDYMSVHSFWFTSSGSLLIGVLLGMLIMGLICRQYSRRIYRISSPREQVCHKITNNRDEGQGSKDKTFVSESIYEDHGNEKNMHRSLDEVQNQQADIYMVMTGPNTRCLQTNSETCQENTEAMYITMT